MPSKYQIIVAMAADEAKSIVSNGEKYMAFLSTALTKRCLVFTVIIAVWRQKSFSVALMMSSLYLILVILSFTVRIF